MIQLLRRQYLLREHVLLANYVRVAIEEAGDRNKQLNLTRIRRRSHTSALLLQLTVTAGSRNVIIGQRERHAGRGLLCY